MVVARLIVGAEDLVLSRLGREQQRAECECEAHHKRNEAETCHETPGHREAHKEDENF